jgi:hypothetical protein
MICLTLLGIGVARSAKGLPRLPELLGKDLNAMLVALPEAVSGTPALLVVGFTRASSGACEVWQKGLEESGELGARCPIFGLVELEGAPFFVPGLVRQSMKGRLPPAIWGRILLLREGSQALKQAVGFDPVAADDPYLALLDAHGGIQWVFHGPKGPEAKAALNARLGRLWDR